MIIAILIAAFNEQYEKYNMKANKPFKSQPGGSDEPSDENIKSQDVREQKKK